MRLITVKTTDELLNKLKQLYKDNSVRNIIVKSSNERDDRRLKTVLSSLKKYASVLYFITSTEEYNLKCLLENSLDSVPKINFKDKIDFFGLDTFFLKFSIDKPIESYATEIYGDYDDSVLFGDGDQDIAIFFPVQNWLKKIEKERELEFILNHCKTKKNILLTKNVSDEEEQRISDCIDVKIIFIK